MAQWINVASGRVGPVASTVQYLLRERGYSVTVDGIVGPHTVTAIKQFQTDQGLTADGVVGNQTWPKLIVEVEQGAQGDAVSAAQDQLHYRYEPPECVNLVVDGVFGPLTDAAVRAFQTDVHNSNQEWMLGEPMITDGIVGEATWRALVIGLGHPVDLGADI